MARLNAPPQSDAVSMIVIYGRILREMVSTDATFVYLFTYIKTNTVPLGRCGLEAVRILTGWYPVMQRLYIYLLTYIKTNTVPHTRCGLGKIKSVHKCGVSNGTVN